MKQKILIFGIMMVFLLSGCGSQPITVDDSKATPESVSAVVSANNRFALELYSKYNSETGNIFFSPYSISTALAMTYEGARGDTAEQIQKVFHFPADGEARRAGYARLYNDINTKSKDYTLSTANALWAQDDYPLLEDYFSTIGQYYGGKATNLDFVGDTENSRKTINTWVEEQTNDKIRELLPKIPPVITPATVLVLTNAIYFKGTWLIQFEKKDTMDRDFRISPENTVKVPMMHLSGEKAKFNYAETEELQVLELPYKGEELSMLILLSKEDDLSKLESSLTSKKISELKASLKRQVVSVFLPKFKFETKYFMAETLADMGMPLAFDSSRADFSGMTGNNDLYISAVIHQAFVDVNEEGTEAAAATAVIMTKNAAMPSNVFNADHPFIFLIQKGDNILFMGRVVDPR